MNAQNQAEQEPTEKPLEILVVEDNPRFLVQAFEEVQRRAREHNRPMNVYFATDYNQAHLELDGDPEGNHQPTKYDGVLTDVYMPVIAPAREEEERRITPTTAGLCRLYFKKVGIADEWLQKLGLGEDVTQRTTIDDLLPCGIILAEQARSQGIPTILVTNVGGHGGIKGTFVVEYAYKQDIYCIHNEMTQRGRRNFALTGDFDDHCPRAELAAIREGKQKDWKTAFDFLLDQIDGVDIEKRFNDRWDAYERKHQEELNRNQEH